MQSNFIFNNPGKKNNTPFFEIQLMEHLTEGHLEKMSTIHSQHHFEMIWLQEGSGIHTLNQHRHQLINNSMHMAVPGQQQQLIIDTGSKGYLISFNEAFLNGCYEDFNGMQEISFFRNISQNEPIQVNRDLAAEIQDLALKLYKENNSLFASKNEIVSKYLKIFIIHVRRQFEACRQTGGTNNNSLFNNFIWLLENNYKEKKAVADYASELSVTPSYLNHVIKKTSGYPASYHIQQRIVLEAKRKVRYTGASMKEVAYYLGFDDISHFSKFFKSSSGMNFTTFKNSSPELRA